MIAIKKEASEILLRAVEHVVSEHGWKLSLFSKANKSFENWLTMELYSTLVDHGLKVQAMPGDGQKRFHDLSFGTEDSLENIVEIKIKISVTQAKYCQSTLNDLAKLKKRKESGFNGGKFLLFFSVFENSYRHNRDTIKYVTRDEVFNNKLFSDAHENGATEVMKKELMLFPNTPEPCEVKIVLFEIK